MFEEQVLPVVRERAGRAPLRKTRAQDRVDVGERRRRGAWPRSTGPTRTRAPRSSPPPARSSCTSPRTTRRDAEAEARLGGAGRGHARPACAAASSARTAASCPRWWPACCASEASSLSVAESCTGGLLAARLTEVPGSSAFLERGFVTYSNRVEGRAARRARRARSKRTARFRRRWRRPWPRGRAASAGVRRRGRHHRHRRSRRRHAGEAGGHSSTSPSTAPRAPACGRALFPGDRERIRFQATQSALEMLRRGLLGLTPL